MPEPSVSIQPLALDNISLLQQLNELLMKLTDEQYANVNESLKSGSIGAHIRHIIDHYVCLLSESDVTDYDKRQRQENLETIRSHARDKIDTVCQQLNVLSGDQTVSVKCSTNCDSSPLPTNSSVARELSFLHSHTTHHMAIIRLLALTQEVCLSTDFGKAVSTQKFERHVQS